MAGRGQDHRQQQNRRGPGDADHLDEAENARPLVIVAGDGRGPGDVGQKDDRIADIEGQQPADQIGGGHPHRGHEQFIGGQGEDRHAGQHPGPVAAEGAAGSVHQDPDRRIEQDVDQPHTGEGQADHRQRQAQAAGVVVGQIDGQGYRKGAHRKARTGESHGGEKREALAGRSFCHAIFLERTRGWRRLWRARPATNERRLLPLGKPFSNMRFALFPPRK